MKKYKFCQVDNFLLILALFSGLFLTGCLNTTPESAAVDNSADGSADQQKMLSVQIFLYNYLDDVAIDQAVPCSPDSVKPVDRKVPKTDNYIEETIKLLLRGEVTDEERSYGFMTEFPDPGLSLASSQLSEDGELTLRFLDKNGFLSGGSCRVGILYTQVEKTAKQFIEVKKVTIVPEELFQP